QYCGCAATRTQGRTREFEAGKSGEVRFGEIKPAQRGEIETFNAGVDAVRKTERKCNRRAHVGIAELRQQRAVDVLDEGMNDALSTMRRTPAAPRSPPKFRGNAWNTALCSLSIGSNVAPCVRTACMKTGPAVTSASLFASNTRLPDCTAAKLARSPAIPTMPA